MEISVSITANSQVGGMIAHMYYHVGQSLSRWYAVEEDMTYFYVALVCAEDTPWTGR